MRDQMTSDLTCGNNAHWQQRFVRRPATMFKDENKQWKPRNKQAALIVRKANENLLHTPPPKTEPTFAPTQQQKVAEYCDNLRKRIEAVEEWKKTRPNRKERREINRLRELNDKKRRERRAAILASNGPDERHAEPPTI